MNQDTVEVNRGTLKKILEMHSDATELLDRIPSMIDEGRINEAAQHIGAELEARITEMNKAEKQDHIIRELLEELANEEIRHDNEQTSFEELEEEILGE